MWFRDDDDDDPLAAFAGMLFAAAIGAMAWLLIILFVVMR